MQPMKSNFLRQFLSILHKELRTEWRGRYGLYASLLFAVMSVTAIALGTLGTPLNAGAKTGVLWVALLFAGVVGLSRTTLREEEQKTADLLRLLAHPAPVFWGKTAYNFLLLFVVSIVIVGLFSLFAGATIYDGLLLAVSLLVGCSALATAITLCGAISAKARAPALLSGVISIPVVFVVLLMGIASLRPALDPLLSGGWTSLAGLLGLTLLFGALGPTLFASVWRS